MHAVNTLDELAAVVVPTLPEIPDALSESVVADEVGDNFDPDIFSLESTEWPAETSSKAIELVDVNYESIHVRVTLLVGVACDCGGSCCGAPISIRT